MELGDITINAAVKKYDRNRSIMIDCDLNLKGDYILRCSREVLLLKDGKKIDTSGANGEGNYTIQKKLSELMTETVTLPAEAGGITLTGGQIALAVEMLSDKFRRV